MTVPRTAKDEALVAALVTLSKAVEQLNERVSRVVKRVRELEASAHVHEETR